ncbi:hypothetical protein [Bdellovibrio bacteriovorus]|uniref:hypothetical protein n=1 Tax=Bdellovibrio bacteriovorus TaxID=959 RepID=UPI003CFCF22F
MHYKPIRYPRRISSSLNCGPHRGPYAWEVEPTPREADERKRRQAERALVYGETLSPEEIATSMESYRRSLEQMATIAIEVSEITSFEKIAEAARVSESQIQLLLQRKSVNLGIEDLLRIIVACRSLFAFDFGY